MTLASGPPCRPSLASRSPSSDMALLLECGQDLARAVGGDAVAVGGVEPREHERDGTGDVAGGDACAGGGGALRAQAPSAARERVQQLAGWGLDVGGGQSRNAAFERRVELDDRRPGKVARQPRRHPDAADEWSLVLDPQHPLRVGGVDAPRHRARELLVAGLDPRQADRPERRPAVARQRLEVEHLLAVPAKVGQQLGLPGPGETGHGDDKRAPRRLTQPSRKSRRPECTAHPGTTSSDPESLPYPVKKRAFRSTVDCTNTWVHGRGSLGSTTSKRRPASVSPRPLATVRPCHTTVRPPSQRTRRSAPLTLTPARGTSSSSMKYGVAPWSSGLTPWRRIDVRGRTFWVTAGLTGSTVGGTKRSITPRRRRIARVASGSCTGTNGIQLSGTAVPYT